MTTENPASELMVMLAPELHRQVLEAASAEGVSASTWMASAARRALAVRDDLAATARSAAEHGRLTAAERSAARRRIAASAADRPEN